MDTRSARLAAAVASAAAAALFAAPIGLLLAASSLDGYRAAFAAVPLARSLFNSAWISTLAAPASLALASMAAFGLTQIAAVPRRRMLLVLLLCASIPLTAVLVPRFVLFDAIGAVGTPLPLFAPVLVGGSPLYCLLLFAALRRLPQAQIDAARIEGLGWLAIWWRIAVPQTRPTHAAVFMLSLMAFWSAFLEPLLYLHREHELTAPLMLHAISLLGSTQWPMLMAAACAITLPVVLSVAVLTSFLHHPFRTR
ncbi:ABC transporter permease subunit [Fontimonas sp. SYSU GA230001]|uniref:ABC transporter permease subunit n=1 Tax=Fontimonas sp. SYSU GA230001 TaxID=3142450 RepID=UPI0032B41E0F